MSRGGGKCFVGNCERPIFRTGYCAAHYSHYRSSKALLVPSPEEEEKKENNPKAGLVSIEEAPDSKSKKSASLSISTARVVGDEKELPRSPMLFKVDSVSSLVPPETGGRRYGRFRAFSKQEQVDEFLKQISDGKETNLQLVNGGSMETHQVKVLADAIATRQLESLALRNCNVGLANIQLIAEALKKNRSLKALHLEENPGFDTSSCSVLFDGLMSHRELLKLKLWHNNIGPLGAVSVANFINVSQKLVYLDLSGNAMGDEGCEEVMHALADNSTVTYVDLGNNGIGTQGAIQISNTLLVNNTISVLKLYWNRIGDEGISHILNALKQAKGSAVRELDLRWTNATAESKVALRDFYEADKKNVEREILIFGYGTKAIAKVKSMVDRHFTPLDDDQKGGGAASHEGRGNISERRGGCHSSLYILFCLFISISCCCCYLLFFIIFVSSLLVVVAVAAVFMNAQNTHRIMKKKKAY